jgi:hypothetical protein
MGSPERLCAEAVLARCQGQTNIMATLGRTLGPFGNAREAYEEADQA